MNKMWKFGFLVFAVFAVFFGVVRIRQQISLSNNFNEEQPQPDENDLNNAKLRILDTDEDTLSDWDEINVYDTSPYLADSDSDGIDDNEEIAQGTDPNCEAGKICGSDIIDTLEQLQQDLEGAPDESGVEVPVAQDFSEGAMQALSALEQGGTPTPDQIRALLRDSGIPEEQLNVAADDELIELFKEVAESTSP